MRPWLRRRRDSAFMSELKISPAMMWRSASCTFRTIFRLVVLSRTCKSTTMRGRRATWGQQFLYSEIMGKARAIHPSSNGAASPQLPTWTASLCFSSAPVSLPFSAASSRIATRTLRSSRANQGSTSASACILLKKLHLWKSNYCTWTDPEYILVTFPPCTSVLVWLKMG